MVYYIYEINCSFGEVVSHGYPLARYYTDYGMRIKYKFETNDMKN